MAVNHDSDKDTRINVRTIYMSHNIYESELRDLLTSLHLPPKTTKETAAIIAQKYNQKICVC